MNPFEQISRLKLRFPTSRGQLTVEDLWGLTLKDLDRLAVQLDEEIKPSRKSFLANPDPKADDTAKKAEIMLEVLKRIIEVKQDENKAKREASAKREQLALMKELLGKKRIEGLEAMSADDIAKKIKELEG